VTFTTARALPGSAVMMMMMVLMIVMTGGQRSLLVEKSGVARK